MRSSSERAERRSDCAEREKTLQTGAGWDILNFFVAGCGTSDGSVSKSNAKYALGSWFEDVAFVKE